MKRKAFLKVCSAIVGLVTIIAIKGCAESDDPIKFPEGTFPDSVYVLTGLNSSYDDYNSDINFLGSRLPIIFSTNRGSSGGQFDLISGSLEYFFDQGTGYFEVSGDMQTTSFYTALANEANTGLNEFGPYSIFSSTDGYEYFMYSSVSTEGQLDLYYIKYLPPYGSSIPDFIGPNPSRLLNSDFNDAYISFDVDEDSAYFCSDRGGNYDIYLQKRSGSLTLENWLNLPFSASVPADSVNSSFNDKFPFVYKDIMVFASDRDGGVGGYDLYYSLFRNGKWSSPVNFGPGINTSSDEARPLVGSSPDFTNNMLVFSSNRPGGAGGFDLYFSGFTFPK